MAKQYDYDDQVPTQYYQAFARAAGCAGQPSVFDCLVKAETAVLQNASATVSESGEFGTFAFLPVTDGEFIQAAPSAQLLRKAVSGIRVLVGVGVTILSNTYRSSTDNSPRTTPTKAHP